MDRTTWLDGLRGIAAAIVAIDHYFMGSVFDAAFRSYWAEPPEENRMLLQLPPIRLLFAAHAMVPLFFVISGYAISITPLRLRNSDKAEFLRRLSSAVTRRILRIYLPVFVIAAISQVLYFCNIYYWYFGDDVVWGRKPWTEPLSHVTFVFRYMIDNMNVLSFQNNGGFNGQLWTMVIEFRGSCIVYLVILGLAFWRPRLRLLALVAQAFYWFYFGVWDVFAFLAGLFLAELHMLSGPETMNQEPKLPHHLRLCLRANVRSINVAAIGTFLCFIFGIWLVCLSDEGILPPGYQFLVFFESSRWESNWNILSRSWKTLGSVLVVYAIGKSTHLQRPLNSAPIQYLGKISFSLYLVHQSIYHLIRDPVRDFLWYVFTQEAYPATIEEAGQRTYSLAFTWLIGFVVMSAINLYAAHLYTKYIDERCVELAKKFDKWVTHLP